MLRVCMLLCECVWVCVGVGVRVCVWACVVMCVIVGASASVGVGQCVAGGEGTLILNPKPSN